MKKITLLFFVFTMLSFTWHTNAQTLNQNAGWPNAAWSISGTYNTDPLAFEADPTTTTNFAFDDDDAGSGSDDSIAAESPIIDLTAAHTAGETWLSIAGDYVYNYLDSDELKFQYWDVDGAAWTDWGFGFTADTTGAPTGDYCSGTAESYSSSILNIATFTATQLSGFRYRISYDDDPAGADWNYGFCFQAPTITSAAPPSCADPISLTGTPTSLTDATLGWTESGTATSWNIEIVDITGGGAVTGTPTASGVSNPYMAMSLTAGNAYTYYVQADCGVDGTSNWSGPFAWSQPNYGDSCSVPISATVEADCSTATPYTIDYSTAGDLGTTDLSCDTFGVNTGAWFEFTAPASGSVKVTFTDTNEYSLYDACGGTEIACVSTAINQADLTGLTAAATYYMAVWKDSATTGTTDVCFEEVSCGAPSAGIAATTIATEASLGWTAGGPESLWDIEIVDITGGGSVTGTPTATGVTNPYTATGLTEGNDYEFYVRADCGGAGASDWAGPYSWSQVLPPANDDCSGAIALTPTAAFADGPIAGQTNAGATASEVADPTIPAPACASYSGGDLWYSVVVPVDGNISLETNADPTGDGGDSGAAAYSGTCGALTLISCDDDGSPDGAYSLVTVSNPALAGQTIYFRVWEYGNNATINFQVGAWSATLSTNDVSFEGFKYFPNPVEGTLSLRAQQNMQQVAVYNMLGQEVINVTPNAMSNELDMSALSRGTYFVRVSIDGAVENFKIIKE